MSRYLSVGRAQNGHLVIWLSIAGRKPLAHLPRWRRHLLHLPAVRWRLWPKPWSFNGPMMTRAELHACAPWLGLPRSGSACSCRYPAAVPHGYGIASGAECSLCGLPVREWRP